MKMNRKVMEFMKENKVSPMGGCLPMVLQIPVFFGFFTMIRSAIELRGAPFLWVGDLSKSDTLFVVPWLSFIPFIGIPGVGLPFNLLPLVMGVTMLWQAHLTPPSPGMDPAQAKMMRYMPLMFMVFFVQLFSRINALLDRAEFIDDPANKIDAHEYRADSAGKTCGIDWCAKKEEIRAS